MGGELQELKTDNNLLLLCTDMDSGHGGNRDDSNRYEGVALEYARDWSAQETLPGRAGS